MVDLTCQYDPMGELYIDVELDKRSLERHRIPMHRLIEAPETGHPAAGPEADRSRNALASS